MSKKRSILLTLVSALLLFLSCCSKISAPSTDSENENIKFQTFTDDLFRQELSGNALTLHYTIQHPSDYGINASVVSLGSYPTSAKEVFTPANDCLRQLSYIHYPKLTVKNQITYRLLQDSLKQTKEGSDYVLYSEPLSPLTGIQSQLPILLSEYRFNTEADVDTYLALLAAVPDNFDNLIQFEQTKSQAGLFMTASTTDSIIEECQSFLDMGSTNYLYSTFEHRLKSLEKLDKKKRESFISQNNLLLETKVFPAYHNLIHSLAKLRDTGVPSGGLCSLPNGIDYYQYLVNSEVGTDRTIAELETLTKQYMKSDLQAIQSLLNKGSITAKTEFKLDTTDPLVILSDLKNKTKDYFPEAPKSKIQVKHVQPEMEAYLSPAFYMVPAIDNASGQTIYINSSRLPDDLDLYTTLAHEGYPGHLYQSTYYDSTTPSPIRSLLGCSGYTEGWATYSEMMSYYFTDLPNTQASLMQHNASLMLGLYALADMGIHYNGWSLLDTITFFREYGIQDVDTIQKIYELILADPANYLNYYIGYIEFLELKKDAVKKWKEDFSQKRFHKEVLEAGPMPFYLLREILLSI